jgi:transcriptional pleiotropic regulator of transition state genes
MSQIKHKVISKGGSLTIPADIRREYNTFLGGEAVDITVEDGKLVITPHTPKCMFCEDTRNVGRYKGRCICRACAAAMWREVGTNG